MFSDITLFVWAVVSHWQSYVTGGAVTGLIGVIERLSNWKMPKWAYAITFLGVFLLMSFFLAWRDQYRLAVTVPTLQQAIQVKDQQIAELKNRPPQINMPPVQVVLPGQQAYVTEVARSLVQLVANSTPMINFMNKNLSQQVAARESTASSICGTVLTERIGVNKEALVPEAYAERAFDVLVKLAAKYRSSAATSDYGPGESSTRTDYCPVLTAEDEKRLQDQSLTYIHAIIYTWKDDAGSHKNEVCEWIQPETIFQAPNHQVWHFCGHHKGLAK